LDSEFQRIFGNYEIIIPTCVLKELQKISASEKYGTMALSLANHKSSPKWYIEFEEKMIKEQKKGGFNRFNISIDDEILQIAKAMDGYVVTNDKDFIKKLSNNGIRSISLRSKKYLKLNAQS
jgi:rRNA-processing protein FCF1